MILDGVQMFISGCTLPPSLKSLNHTQKRDSVARKDLTLRLFYRLPQTEDGHITNNTTESQSMSKTTILIERCRQEIIERFLNGYEAYVQLQPPLKQSRRMKNNTARCQIPNCRSVITPGSLRICLEKQESREVTPQYFGEGCIDHSLYHLACFEGILNGQVDRNTKPDTFKSNLVQAYTNPDRETTSAAPNRSSYGRTIKPSPKLESNNHKLGETTSEAMILTKPTKRKRDEIEDDNHQTSAQRVPLFQSNKRPKEVKINKEAPPGGHLHPMPATNEKERHLTKPQMAMLSLGHGADEAAESQPESVISSQTQLIDRKGERTDIMRPEESIGNHYKFWKDLQNVDHLKHIDSTECTSPPDSLIVSLKLPKSVLRKLCQEDNLLSDSDCGDSPSKRSLEALFTDPSNAPRSMKDFLQEEAQEAQGLRKSLSPELKRDTVSLETEGGCTSSNEGEDLQSSVEKVFTKMLPEEGVIEKSQLTILVAETVDLIDFDSEELNNNESTFRSLHSRIHPELRYTDYNSTYNLPPHHVTAISTWQKGCIYENLIEIKKSATYEEIQLAFEAIPYSSFEATKLDGEVITLDPIESKISPLVFKTLDSMFQEADKIVFGEDNGKKSSNDDLKTDFSLIKLYVETCRARKCMQEYETGDASLYSS